MSKHSYHFVLLFVLSLFNFQGPLCLIASRRVDFHILPHAFLFVNTFFEFFISFFDKKSVASARAFCNGFLTSTI